ncbi:MAG: hypothetical protein M1433_01365 [Candidatus Parvarchaeota archaeon]|nr:hypothetical protein [Candidatus Parvarchaeota archaeon]
MQFNKTIEKLVHNPILYVILGAITAILIARVYVLLGGSVTFTYDGIYLHHLFYGVILVAIVGILAFLFNDKLSEHNRLKKTLAFLFGLGLGLIIDESNLLILTGQEYSLTQYYSYYNIIIEFSVIILLIVALVVSVMTRALLDRYRKKR